MGRRQALEGGAATTPTGSHRHSTSVREGSGRRVIRWSDFRNFLIPLDHYWTASLRVRYMGFDANVYLVTLTLIALFNLAFAPLPMLFGLLSHVPWVGIAPSLLLLTTSGGTCATAHGSVCIEDYRPSHARSPISAISRAKAGRHSLIRCAIGLLFARVQG